MAVIPFFRVVIFVLITLFSLVVLGICAHIEYLVSGNTNAYLTFSPLGLSAACLTILSLPLLLVLGGLRHRVFASMILFEIIWFFVLWALWIGTASDTVIGNTYRFPAGCINSNYPAANQLCYEIMVVEAFAFLNFFCAFIYYDVIFLYAIVNAIRGNSVWAVSVKEAATGSSGTPVAQPQFNVLPATQHQSYDTYPSQVLQGPPTQLYNAYSQQIPAQGLAPQPYNVYSQQASLYSPFTTIPGQNQPHNYPPPGAPQQQVNYDGYVPSPTSTEAPLSPPPSYNSYSVNGSHVQHPLRSRYQGQPMQHQEPPFRPVYGLHQPILV